MKSPMKSWCTLAAALVASCPNPAGAGAKSPPPVQLALYYSVPRAMSAACYDLHDFKDRMYVAVRYGAFESPSRDGALRVEIRAVDGEVEVTWVHEDRTGKQVRPGYTGRAKTCREALDDAIASLKDYLPPRPPPSAEAPLTPVFVALGGGIGVRLGSSRAPALGLGIDVAARWREAPVSLALEVRAALPALAEVPAMRGTSIGTWVVTGALVPCAHWRWLVGCAMVEAGAIRSAGAELAATSDTAGPYVAMGVRAGLEIPVRGEPLALRVSGDLTGVLAVAQISSSSAHGDVWRMPRINGALMAGVVGFFGK